MEAARVVRRVTYGNVPRPPQSRPNPIHSSESAAAGGKILRQALGSQQHHFFVAHSAAEAGIDRCQTITITRRDAIFASAIWRRSPASRWAVGNSGTCSPAQPRETSQVRGARVVSRSERSRRIKQPKRFAELERSLRLPESVEISLPELLQIVTVTWNDMLRHAIQ